MPSWAFLSLMLLVLGPCQWYVWRRMVRDTTRPGAWRIAGTVIILALAGCLLVAFSARVRDWVPEAVHGNGTRLTLVGMMWVAVLFYLLLTLLVLEIPRLLLRRRAQAAATAGADERLLHRRLVIARGLAITAGLTAGSIVGYGVKTALGPPVVRRIQLPLAKLQRSLDGYRIAVVADVHIGPLTGVAHARRIVDALNSLDADLVAMVGDLADGDVDERSTQAEPLRQLKSRDGTFFVTGNHEYYSGVEQWVAKVRELGMRPLRNDRVTIRGLELAGVDDVTGGSDVAKAMAGRDPALPAILLAHQPVVASEAARHGVDLQLSGHTHGGQMVPFNLLARIQQPVISGLGEVDGMPVYVTNGAGFWGPPVRVGAQPDVTLVELRSR